MKKLIFVLAMGLVLGITTSSYAALTSILEPTSYGDTERWLVTDKAGSNGTSILNYLFGSGNYTRTDDSIDQLWNAYAGAGVRSVATYADNQQNLWAGTQDVFTFPGGKWASLTDGLTANINEAVAFRFLDNSGVFWSSIPGENPDGLDHMVTWVLTNSGTNYVAGDYVMAWEDSGIGGDYDYNDMVYLFHSVAPTEQVIPEPSSLMLLGMGVLGLFGLKKRT